MSLICSLGRVVARAGAFGASSVRFELPLSLLSPERAREASGIVYRSTDEGCLEEQLHRTRGCGTFCSHLRLGVRARPARGRLIKSHWAVHPALDRVPDLSTHQVLGTYHNTTPTSDTRASTLRRRLDRDSDDGSAPR